MGCWVKLELMGAQQLSIANVAFDLEFHNQEMLETAVECLEFHINSANDSYLLQVCTANPKKRSIALIPYSGALTKFSIWIRNIIRITFDEPEFVKLFIKF